MAQHQQPPAAVSRTAQYKKVTKPLLERKRRARINRCLDELKELMVGALEAEGENVSKLEKADILELTVRHLQRLARPGDSSCWQSSRFQAGFKQCASEACQFLLTLPGLDARLSRRLVAHLGTCVDATATATSTTATTTSSPPNSPCPASSSQPPGPLSVQVPPPVRRGFSPPVSPCSLAGAPPLGAALSSTPSAQDLAKPMAGLLMTVPSSQSGMWRPW